MSGLKEFWEWCIPIACTDKLGTVWEYERKLHKEPPDLDLDNIFRYAVPKLRTEYGEDISLQVLSNWIQEVVIHYETARGNEAEMLWRAIWEVIHGS